MCLKLKGSVEEGDKHHLVSFKKTHLKFHYILLFSIFNVFMVIFKCMNSNNKNIDPGLCVCVCVCVWCVPKINIGE